MQLLADLDRMVKVSFSLRAFRATKQNQSRGSNKEQKLGCHFKVASELPARLISKGGHYTCDSWYFT